MSMSQGQALELSREVSTLTVTFPVLNVRFAEGEIPPPELEHEGSRWVFGGLRSDGVVQYKELIPSVSIR